MEPAFKIQNLDHGETIEIIAEGELDEVAWESLKARLVRLIGIRQPTLIRLDLRLVSARSSPPGNWIEAERAASKFGGEFALVGPPPNLRADE